MRVVRSWMTSISLKWCPLQDSLSHTALMLALQKNIVAKMGSPECVFTGKSCLNNSSICCTSLLSALRFHVRALWIHSRMSIELPSSNCSGSQHTEHPQLLFAGLIPRAGQNLTAFYWNAEGNSLIPLEFGIYCTYSAFVPGFIPTTCPGNWGSTAPPFQEKFRDVYIQQAMSIVTPQNSEQAKTNLLKYDRGASYSLWKAWWSRVIGKSKMWVMLGKSGRSLAVLGRGPELEETEHGVTSEVLRARVLVFLPFSLGSKEPSDS